MTASRRDGADGVALPSFPTRTQCNGTRTRTRNSRRVVAEPHVPRPSARWAEIEFWQSRTSTTLLSTSRSRNDAVAARRR